MSMKKIIKKLTLLFRNKNFLKIILVFLFSMGVVLRIVQYAKFDTYQGDDGNELLVADNALRFGKFTITGEGSSLDEEGQFFFHNLPYSLYFQTLIYFFGFMDPRAYMFIYVLLNLLVCVLIFQIAKNFFSLRVGIMAYMLALFSSVLVWESTFASQPTNALIFETVALYFMSRFYRKPQKKFFLLSFVSATFALHMYPPMYLLLPIKIIFLAVYMRKYLLHEKKVLFACLIFFVLSYLPLFINEIRYYGDPVSNFLSVRNFIGVLLTENGQHAATLPKVFHGWSQAIAALPGLIHGFFVGKWWGLLLCLSLSFFVAQKRERKILFIFLLCILLPLVLVVLVNPQFTANGWYEKTYLHICILYLIPLLAVGLSSPKFFVGGVLLALFMFTKSFKVMEPQTTFYQRQSVAQQIVSMAQDDSLPLDKINLTVLSDKYGQNSGSWDNSMYWYFLQRWSDHQLVDVSFPFLTPEKLQQNSKQFFVICEYRQNKIQICQKKIDELYPSYKISKVFLDQDIPVFVLN